MRRDDDPQLTDDEADLVATLRALPPETDAGDEPDWGALERSIHARVGPDVPRRWWQTWRLGAPVAAVAAAAVAVLVWVHARPAPLATLAPDAPIAAPAVPVAAEAIAPLPLWLDGEAVDLASDPAAALRALDDDAADDDENGALLPASDLAWVDDLDAESIAQAEQWLAKEQR